MCSYSKFFYMPGTDKNNRQQNNNEDKRDSQNDAKSITEALKQAEKDIKKDPALTNKRDPRADLDEGELARLEGEE
jgi:hypothetical protein